MLRNPLLTLVICDQLEVYCSQRRDNPPPPTPIVYCKTFLLPDNLSPELMFRQSNRFLYISFLVWIIDCTLKMSRLKINKRKMLIWHSNISIKLFEFIHVAYYILHIIHVTYWGRPWRIG